MRIFIVLFSLLFASWANAAVIIVNDGDQFDYDAANTYQFVGALSATNTILTYGFAGLDPGESFDFLVTSPAEFALGALVSTGPNGFGTTIFKPNISGTIAAGTSFLFPLDGNFFSGQTHWITVGIGPGAYSIIDSQYGGSFGVDNFYTNSSGGGNGGGASAVPAPPAIWLFGFGLLGLALVAGKKKNFF